jgi:hypothetical protein
MKNYLAIMSLLLFSGCASVINYQIKPVIYPNTNENNWGNGRELFFEFIRFTGCAFTRIEASAHTKNPYKSLYIQEISGVIDGKKIIFLKNKKKAIPSMEHLANNFYCFGETNELNGSFWVGEVNLKAKFKYLDTTGTYDMELTQIYSFDDEPLQTQTFAYKVYCFENDLEKPWFMYPDTP